MATSTAGPRAAQATRPRPQWLRVTRVAGGTHIYLGLRFWAIVVTAAVVVLAVVSRFAEIRLSAVYLAHQGALWFPFGFAIAVVSGGLTLAVANGLTRRAFVRGVVLVTVLSAVAYAVILTLLLGLEGQVYDQLGWTQRYPGTQAPLALHAGWWIELWGRALVFTAGGLSGLLVGAVYYRLGGWLGTLCLPLSLSPLAIVAVFGLRPGRQWGPVDTLTLDLGLAGTLLGLATLALTWLAIHLVLRRAPVHTKEA